MPRGWLLAVALVGCGGTEAPVGAPPEAQLGVSMSDMFVAVSDGDTVGIVHGPQGGYHFLMSVRAEGGNVENASFQLTGVDPAGGKACSGYYPGPVWMASTAVAGAVELPYGARCIIDSPNAIVDMDVHVTVDLTDGAGRKTSATRTIHAGPIGN